MSRDASGGAEGGELDGLRRALAFGLASAFFFIALWFLPLVQVSKIGLERELLLGGLGSAIAAQDMRWLGRFVDFCVVLAPAAALAALLAVTLAALLRRPFPGWRAGVALVHFGARWAMLEVLLLAILLSFLKIGALADARFGEGFYALAAAVVFLLLGMQAFDGGAVRSRLEAGAEKAEGAVPRHGGSEAVALALLISAAAALLPANLLPMMEMNIAGQRSADTIFGGVVLLLHEGMWGIGLIVFIASFVVPIGKLAGLAYLLWQARRAGEDGRGMRLHRWLDFIGRWSMLDILLIGLLSGLIQFHELANVRPGPAAPAFAAAVVLTILAVEAFPLSALQRRTASHSS
jgi:paraquat-inducible protein A